MKFTYDSLIRSIDTPVTDYGPLGCMMINVVPDEYVRTILDSISDDLIYNEPGYGMPDLHVTLKYGIIPDGLFEDHKSIMEEAEQTITRELQGEEFYFLAPDRFGNSDDYSALVLEVDDMDGFFAEANEVLSRIPHVDTYYTYRPHMTLCYLKGSVPRTEDALWPSITDQELEILAGHAAPSLGEAFYSERGY